MDGEPVWGVTALQAVQEMDAGPIWASRTFPVGPDPPRKSTLYNGPVTDAAVALVHEVVDKAPTRISCPNRWTTPGPTSVGRLRPAARQRDRGFSWSDPTEHVLRRIRAADGAPGVYTRAVRAAGRGLRRPPRAGRALARRRRPGTVVARRHGAVLVRTGDGAIWIGHLRSCADSDRVHKLPATTVLADHLAEVPEAERTRGYREISYRRDGPVGMLDFRFYNGAMSTAQCRRLLAALRHATAQDTRVLLLRGGAALLQRPPPGRHRRGTGPGRGGLGQHRRDRRRLRGDHHLRRPAGRVRDGGQRGRRWGHAGAGRRPGAAPRRGGAQPALPDAWACTARNTGPTSCPAASVASAARSLTTDCLPIGAAHAARIGLVDQTFPGDPGVFERVVERLAHRLADHRRLPAAPGRRSAIAAPATNSTSRCAPTAATNWTEMSADILDDRHGFASARHGFITKRRARLAAGTTL